MIDLIDTHCHLNFQRYDEDRDAVIKNAAAAGVKRIIIPAVDIQTGTEALPLADQYSGVYVAVGIHPYSRTDFTEAIVAAIEMMAKSPKVIAIGEIGLDYYRDRSPKHIQHLAFKTQLALAAKLELPVIIHNREADNDTLAILEAWVKGLPKSLKARPGVLHSFSASQETADRALALGFYLGFTGPVTFKNADSLRRIAASVPLDRILAETDGPFLTPAPYRGKRNEPAYIPHIIERLATLKAITPGAMAQATTENATNLFNMTSER